MTVLRKAIIRTVRLDDDVWAAVKAMDCSLNQYLRVSLLCAESLPSPIYIPSAVGATETSKELLADERPVIDNRPKNAFCKHCGNRFAGVKFATICGDCKSSGHTLTPNECPVCNEARAL